MNASRSLSKTLFFAAAVCGISLSANAEGSTEVAPISDALTVASDILRASPSDELIRDDERAFIATGTKIEEDSISITDDDFSLKNYTTLVGLLIDKMGPEQYDAYARIKSLTVHAGAATAIGVYHHFNNGGAYHCHYGSVIAENISIQSKAESSGLCTPVIGKPEIKAVSTFVAGIYQEPLTWGGEDRFCFLGNVALCGDVSTLADSSISAFGIFAGGDFGYDEDGKIQEDSVVDLMGLTVSAGYGDATGVYAVSSTHIVALGRVGAEDILTEEGKTLKSEPLTVQSAYGKAVGVYVDSGEISAITDYAIHVKAGVGASEEGDSSSGVSHLDLLKKGAAVGIHLKGASGNIAISGTTIDVESVWGLGVGVAVENATHDVSLFRGVTLDVQSTNGRAVGITVDGTCTDKVSINESTVKVTALGAVYGLVYGKDVSCNTENGWDISPIGGVALYNSETKDSQNLSVTYSVISVNTTGTRDGTSPSLSSTAIGLYLADGKTYSLAGNTFDVSGNGDVYGAYLEGNATIESGFSVSASTNAVAYGVRTGTSGSKVTLSGTIAASSENAAMLYGLYADGVEVTASKITAHGKKQTYGVYAKSKSEVKATGAPGVDAVAKSVAGEAYGIYADSATVYGRTVEAASASGFDAYGIYAANGATVTGSFVKASTSGTGETYGVYLVGSTLGSSNVKIEVSGEKIAYGISAFDSTISDSTVTVSTVVGDDETRPETVYFIRAGGASTLTDVSVASDVVGSGTTSYGLYLESSASYTLTREGRIELGTGQLSVDATVYGAYLTGASSIDGGAENYLSFEVETTESEANAYGLYLVGKATAKNVGTVSVTAENAAAYGVVLSGSGSVGSNSVTASGTSATGILVEEDFSTTERRTHSVSGTVKATSVNSSSVDSAYYENYVAVDVQDEAVLIFDGATLSALGGKGVALKSSGDVALTISGNAMLNGDVLAGTRGDQVLNVTSGVFTFKSSGVSASEIVLGTETSVAAITLSGQDSATNFNVNFNVGTLTFHAQQNGRSTLKIDDDVSVSDSVSQINVKFADGFTCKSGDFVMFVVGNGIADDATLVDAGSSALSVSVCIGGVALSENAYSWTSGSVNGVNGYGILFAVPEPSAFGLLAGLGALALCAARCRRRSR